MLKDASIFAKVAATFAVMALLGFGLCTAGFVFGTSVGNKASEVVGSIAIISGFVCAVGILGLVVLAVIAILRSVIDMFHSKEPRS